MSRSRSVVVGLMLAVTACGGPAGSTARAPDEVTATWTAGDDAPLGDAGQSSEDGTGDQPGGPKT